MATETVGDPVKYEGQYVQQFYDRIATQFDQTRHSVWPTVKDFLNQVKTGDAVLEVGCGNGKNLVYLKSRGFQPGELVVKGSDLCRKLCQITREKLGDWVTEIEVVDQLKLRDHYQENQFQYVLSIAVIHHLSTLERRIQAIEELLWVTAPGGLIMIQVWAMEQPDDSRRRFTQGDNLVSWQTRNDGSSKGGEVVDRYCHVFQKGELDQLVEERIGVQVRESFYSKGNWVLILEKKI